MITAEEFQKLPEDSGPVYHELRHGEIVALSRPKFGHIQIQKRLERMLERIAGESGVVVMEFSFRPTEYECQTWRLSQPMGGAPELVVEVLSPSNTPAEISDKERLFLDNGAQEFWVVDPDWREVKVSRPAGHTHTYRYGESIPLELLANSKLAVADIFG